MEARFFLWTYIYNERIKNSNVSPGLPPQLETHPWLQECNAWACFQHHVEVLPLKTDIQHTNLPFVRTQDQSLRQTPWKECHHHLPVPVVCVCPVWVKVSLYMSVHSRKKKVHLFSSDVNEWVLLLVCSNFKVHTFTRTPSLNSFELQARTLRTAGRIRVSKSSFIIATTSESSSRIAKFLPPQK